MSQNLTVVARNPQPKRELYQPDLWLIYTPGERPIEVHLSQSHNGSRDWIPLDIGNSSLT
jgi:hypothetical protein